MKQLCSFVFTILIFASSVSFAVPLNLQPDEVALLGYGSLMSRESMSKTLGRDYDGPVVPVEIQGYQRAFNVAMPNDAFYEVRDGQAIVPPKIAYLNITPAADPNESVNAVLFVIKKSDLPGFDRREWIYHRENVANSLKSLEVQGEAIVYSGSQQYLCADGDPQVAIRASYIEIVRHALQKQPSDFAAKYNASTLPSHHPIIQDLKREGADPFGYHAKKSSPRQMSCEAIFD